MFYIQHKIRRTNYKDGFVIASLVLLGVTLLAYGLNLI